MSTLECVNESAGQGRPEGSGVKKQDSNRMFKEVGTHFLDWSSRPKRVGVERVWKVEREEMKCVNNRIQIHLLRNCSMPPPPNWITWKRLYWEITGGPTHSAAQFPHWQALRLSWHCAQSFMLLFLSVCESMTSVSQFFWWSIQSVSLLWGHTWKFKGREKISTPPHTSVNRHNHLMSLKTQVLVSS